MDPRMFDGLATGFIVALIAAAVIGAVAWEIIQFIWKHLSITWL